MQCFMHGHPASVQLTAPTIWYYYCMYFLSSVLHPPSSAKEHGIRNAALQKVLAQRKQVLKKRGTWESIILGSVGKIILRMN